jgi:hypothetical protein
VDALMLFVRDDEQILGTVVVLHAVDVVNVLIGQKRMPKQSLHDEPMLKPPLFDANPHDRVALLVDVPGDLRPFHTALRFVLAGVRTEPTLTVSELVRLEVRDSPALFAGSGLASLLAAVAVIATLPLAVRMIT